MWPICNRDMTRSFLDFLKAGLHSAKMGFIWKCLLLMLLFQCCCHFERKTLLIWGFKSVYGMEILLCANELTVLNRIISIKWQYL